MIIKGLTDSAVDRAEGVREAISWEEWKEDKEKEQESTISVQEEKWLWKRLEESDREQVKEERDINLKKNRKIASIKNYKIPRENIVNIIVNNSVNKKETHF